MDRAGKKVASRADFGRTKSSVTFRDRNHDSRNSTQGCSRLDCSSRHHSTNGATNGATTSSSEKLKNSRTTQARSLGTESPVRLRKSKDKRVLPSAKKRGTAPSHCQEHHMEETEPLDNLEPFTVGASYHKEEIVGSSRASCSRDANPEYDNLGKGVSRDSVRNPIESSRNVNRSLRAIRGPNIDSQRHGLRNLGRGSKSPNNSTRPEDTLRRKNPKTENPKWRITGGSTSSPRDTSTSPNASITPTPSINRRHPTNNSSSSNRSSSTTTTPDATTHRRENRMRFTKIEDDMFSLPEPLLPLQQPQLRSRVPNSPMARSSSRVTPTRPSCNGGYGSTSTRGARRRQDNCNIDGSSGIECDPFVEGNDHHHFHTDGIAEVLLALDRIGQDEELSYEQLVMLEANLALSGFSFFDRHRDLRLDIDNMSYEELLDLGERMGTVDTALSDEQIAKSLRKFTFKSIPASFGGSCNDDDSKCSICQEDYLEGDEVGRLSCEHLYHVGCICQWFQLKNWCPICKSPAVSPSKETNPQMGQPMLD